MHVHNSLVLKYKKKLNFPITKKEEPYGSIELMREVIKVLNQENYILMKNHGFLSLGKTIEEAGKKALSSHDQALAFSKLSFS